MCPCPTQRQHHHHHPHPNSIHSHPFSSIHQNSFFFMRLLPPSFLTSSSLSISFHSIQFSTTDPALTRPTHSLAMRSFLIPSLVSLLAPIISAQTVNLLASNLPACATGCSVLDQAQGSCTPPLAPVTSDDIYESCFCQSALLTSLYASAAVQGVCPSCSAADMLTIQKWYQGVCPNAGKGAPNFGNLATGPTTSSTATTPGPTTSTATSAPQASASTANQQDSNSSTDPTPGPW